MARRHLPSLRALQAFEAAARLGSFRLAAEELAVTRSAVSHQIRQLEEMLGVSLFRRDRQRADLTEAGQDYYPTLRDAFDQIEAKTRTIKPASDSGELVVQVYVTVALKWLIPRLHDFERRCPDVKLRLSTTSIGWDFERGEVHAAFLLVRHKTPGLHYQPLFPGLLSPVCSPDLLGGTVPLDQPSDLGHHRLIRVLGADEDWATWLEARGLDPMLIEGGPVYDSYLLAQEAAIDGRGIAMTLSPFAEDEIRLGRLVRPFPPPVAHRRGWYFVCEMAERTRPKIRRFEAWLREQIAADPAIQQLLVGAADR
ncbi:transcriptional regulator GcvA [Rhodoligotrophos defluvii]|uniref:transcriptional regulator GcvA n=1 Tax=Rhodoligotrophos defluvii TaxID=2561934 RepID=UPI001485ADBC|nr:transcriptional regulator GcvA [Rhodoligotrophos defluvii]